MNINTASDRCVKIAAELRSTEQNLRYAAGSIEEVINSLKRSEDEAMQIVAAKLQKTLDKTNSENRTIRMMHMVLEKAAAMYGRTESEISDYGDAGMTTIPARVYPQNLKPVKDRTDRIFEKL